MYPGSKPSDPEFGKDTQIRISVEIRKMIEDEKIIPRESINDCLKRIIAGYKELQTLKKASDPK